MRRSSLFLIASVAYICIALVVSIFVPGIIRAGSHSGPAGAPPTVQLAPTAVELVTKPGVNPAMQAITLKNNGSSALDWAADPLPGWASLNPTAGTLAAGSSTTLNLNVALPLNVPQTYTTTLVVRDTGGSNPAASMPVTVVSAAPSTTWYFAEGYTGSGFTEYLTIANPNPTPTSATVNYLIQGGSPIPRQYQLAASSRFTLNLDTEVGKGLSFAMVVTGSQPIIAERPMYFTFASSTWKTNLPGGSDVLGATAPGTDFDFGYLDTTTNHDTYLTILNQDPGPMPMQVTISYFSAGGGNPTVIQHTVPPTSRGTVHVNDEGLPLGTYSALVHLSVAGLVERPMYLKDTATGNTGAADVIGVTQPLRNWYFAEGYVSPTFTERYMLSNPSTTNTASGTITFFLASGAPVTVPFTLNPGAQTILDAGTIVQGNNSAQVQAAQPILAERFMSFQFTPGLPGATDVLGAAQPSNLCYFAEGFAGSGFSEYLTIENPDATNTATVQVTFLPAAGGTPIVQFYSIAPSSRFTLNTGSVMSGQSFSMVVESNVAVVAERPMYFIYTSNQAGGSDVVGYQPAAPLNIPPPPTSTPSPTATNTPSPTPTPGGGGGSAGSAHLLLTTSGQNIIIESLDANNNGWQVFFNQALGGAITRTQEIDNGVATDLQDQAVLHSLVQSYVQTGGTFHSNQEQPGQIIVLRNTPELIGIETISTNTTIHVTWTYFYYIWPNGQVYIQLSIQNTGTTPVNFSNGDSVEINMDGLIVGDYGDQSPNAWYVANGTVQSPIPVTVSSTEASAFGMTPTVAGLTTGFFLDKFTSWAAAGAANTGILYLGNTTRSKDQWQGNLASLAPGQVLPFSLLLEFRRTMTQSQGISFDSDYRNPSLTVNTGTLDTTDNEPVQQTLNNGFNMDVGAYVISATNDQVNAQLNLTAGVTTRWAPRFKVVGWFKGAPTVTWGGRTLTAGVDYNYVIDSSTNVLYVQLNFDVVAGSPGPGQQANAPLNIS